MDGIEWYHFRKLIERNKLPWRVLRYYRSKHGFKDTVTICDMTLPRRKGHVKTGYSEHDWWRDSYICNAGYTYGTLPLWNIACEWDWSQSKWVRYPTRGAVDAMKLLISDGVVEDTQEIKEFIRTGYWRP